MSIDSGASGLPAGVQYGAVTGMTDGGFGGFSAQAIDVILSDNGTMNYDMLFTFGYTAHHEMIAIGKAFAKDFFSMADKKLSAYYFACTEGGRGGYSQVQHFADDWDGAVIGAPALRYGQQQVNHLYGNVVEKTMGYTPPPCELEKIVNLTIIACDSLDGKTDNLIARTDLCKLPYNISHAVGESYSCAASGDVPAQKGKVTAEGVAVAKKILDGLVTAEGKRDYLYYQPTAFFDDAAATYNSSTEEWDVSISGLSTSWITMFLNLQEVDTITSIGNVTYETLRDWMNEGMQRYYDVLQTTWPDLSPFQSAGGKIIHIHGESDPSIPSASSVRYHESVRQVMYLSMSFKKSHEAMNDWNRLFWFQRVPIADLAAINMDLGRKIQSRR
jgi:tannase